MIDGRLPGLSRIAHLATLINVAVSVGSAGSAGSAGSGSCMIFDLKQSDTSVFGSEMNRAFLKSIITGFHCHSICFAKRVLFDYLSLCKI